jgi:GDPmannose 4,6-dehydratase
VAPDVALIFGISGQDGAYLARLLLERGFVGHGTSRGREMSSFVNLSRLGVRGRIFLHSAIPSDFRSVLFSRVQPIQIYDLAEPSLCGCSFDEHIETLGPGNAYLRRRSPPQLRGSECRAGAVGQK